MFAAASLCAGRLPHRVGYSLHPALPGCAPAAGTGPARLSATARAPSRTPWRRSVGAHPQPKLYPSQRGGLLGTAPAALACAPLLVNLACSLPRPHCPALLLPLLQAFSLSFFPSFSLEWVSSCPAAAAGTLRLLRLLRVLRSPLCCWSCCCCCAPGCFRCMGPSFCWLSFVCRAPPLLSPPLRSCVQPSRWVGWSCPRPPPAPSHCCTEAPPGMAPLI